MIIAHKIALDPTSVFRTAGWTGGGRPLVAEQQDLPGMRIKEGKVCRCPCGSGFARTVASALNRFG